MRYATVLIALFLTAASSDPQSEKLRLGLFTGMVPVRWDVEANWRAFEQAFVAHAGEGIDLVVTPECFLDGYAAEAKDWTLERFSRIAQDVNTSPYIARVRALAKQHRTSIAFGFTENDHGKFYDCALLVDRQGGITGHYHKTHLQDCDLRFSPGADLPVFETAWGKCGILICADRRWPETARVLRLKGAKITLIPAYGMWHLDNEWWMRTRSYENENFVAFVHPQVAFVSDPQGQLAAKLQTNIPSMLVCDIDLAQVSDKAHIRDRRPELYQDIARPGKSAGNSTNATIP
jgi:predicted amidohydrolase